MSFIGEALLSAAITTLFDKLSSLSTDLLQFARQEQIHADLEEWKKILEKIQAVLDDAAEKQTEKNLVKIWLGELKKLAYDAEDILDEFATEALERKFLEEPQASTSKVLKLIPTCCTGLSPRSLKRNSAMASQIKEITTRLQMILKEKNDFDLKENWGTSPNQDRSQTQRDPKTSLNEPHIYGRDEDKEAIVLEVLKDEDTDAQFSVISIYGMGGIGKTTLAQLVYNDATLKDHFDVKAWIYVSENFNVTQVTKTILQSIDQNTGDVNDLNMLQVKLKEKLSGKKFFIVLDDVWNESYENWTELCLPFDGGSKGSKIMVTTRNRSVSLISGAFVPYQLKELSTNDCLSVFTRHSLGKEDFSEHGCLEEIGKKIIGKCAGLPLAAKTLGGLLRGKPDCKQWEDVLESNIWNLPHEEKSGLVPALKVSYYYLPSHLKQCFAYCSILPKGHKFGKEDLILLWMAEGFLQTNSKKQAEEFGEEYFDDLHSRSFFQQSAHDVSCFFIHDLINDLAQWVAKDFCFRIENLQEGEKEWKIPVNLRHLCCLIDRSNYENLKESGAFNKMKSVRTFLALSPFFWFADDFSVVLCMVFQLQRLRVLSLRGYPIIELPNSIGDLKLLHHLDLSHTAIECLPDSVNKLYNLEALILKGCCHLKRLCSDMGNLIKLCNIDVSCVDQLEAMPLGIGKLTSLRTLQRFVVGKDKISGLKELKDLKHLQERLHISGLENVNDFVDAENANLNGKDGLKDLQLEWTCSSDGSNEKEIAAQVLEKLRPCQKLESLHIRGYHGTRFSRWLGHSYLSSLVSLTFEDCKNCASFPSIGQLSSLKKLVIRNIEGIKSLGQEFYGHGYNSRAPFQSLEEFTIESLQEWKDWFPCGSGRNVEAFPRLRKISIRKCSKLEGKLPEHLPLLQSLSIKDCDSLTCIARVQLPPNLKRLVINHCSNLLTVLDEEEVSGSCKNTSCLEKLKIEDCPSLTSLWSSSGNLPRALRYLSVTQCSKLESIANGFHDNAKLEELYIGDCEKLETLPRGINNLISLKKLAIDKCPAMVSIPEGGFPTSLTFLVIRDANIYKSLLEWGLHRLMSLEFLGIGGCPDVISFPQEETGMILPSSLTTLWIMDFPNLKRLSSIAQNLTCLEMLGLLSCPKLKYFPDVGLPQSLKQLQIKDCPLLEGRCKKGKGIYWPIWLRYGCPTYDYHLKHLHLSGYHNSDSDFSDSSEPDD